MTILSPEGWEDFLGLHPGAHLLQTTAWAELKRTFGWQPVWIQAGQAGAQVLFRSLPLGFSVAYLPKGPLGSGWDQLWPEIDRVCRARKAVFLKVEPDVWEGTPGWDPAVMQGFQPAKAIQPRRTVVISLQGTADDWLERMKQKTRYNIRLAERKEVTVRRSSDVALFYGLMVVTGQRDGFGIHSEAYYQYAFDQFSQRGQCVLLLASYEEKPLAALMAFSQGERAWYLYGASNNLERNRMPTYLLQWEAMRWAAAQGCTYYDLYGIPDIDEAQLEEQFSDRSDGLWGVYRFKRGFGGDICRSVGAFDRVYQPLLYRAYQMYVGRRGEEQA